MSNPTELPDLPKPFGIIDIYDDAGSYMGCRDGFTADQMRGYLLDYAVKIGLAQPEGEAPQADPYKLDDDDEMRYPNGTDVAIISAKRYYELRGFEEAATLSPLCGAQHAESGKEVGLTIGEAFKAVGGWMNGGELGYPSFGSMNALLVYTQKMVRAALAAQQAAAPGALDEQALRDMFERDAATHLGIDHAINRTSFRRDDDGGYQYAATRRLFALWKAAREAAGTFIDEGTSAPGTPEAPQGSIGDLTEFHILLNWYDNEASYGSINEGRNKLTEYIDKWADRRAAQLDGGQGEGNSK